MLQPQLPIAIESDEPRLFLETGVAARVAEVTAPALHDLGFRLVRVKISSANGCTVQIMAERPDGSFTIDDCELASRALSPVLDVADLIDKAYHLELSSPGIDRPLMRASDFARWQGHEVKIALNAAMEGRRRLKGVIGPLDGEGVKIAPDTSEAGLVGELVIPFALISEARLVLTDELIRETLRREAKPDADEDDTDLGEADPAAPSLPSGRRRKRHGR